MHYYLQWSAKVILCKLYACSQTFWHTTPVLITLYKKHSLLILMMINLLKMLGHKQCFVIWKGVLLQMDNIFWIPLYCLCGSYIGSNTKIGLRSHYLSPMQDHLTIVLLYALNLLNKLHNVSLSTFPTFHFSRAFLK